VALALQEQSRWHVRNTSTLPVASTINGLQRTKEIKVDMWIIRVPHQRPSWQLRLVGLISHKLYQSLIIGPHHGLHSSQLTRMNKMLYQPISLNIISISNDCMWAQIPIQPTVTQATALKRKGGFSSAIAVTMACEKDFNTPSSRDDHSICDYKKDESIY